VSSFVFATQPITGHVVPAVPMVRALVERGHDVRWYVGQKFRPQVEAAGAEFLPYDKARDYDDADYDAAFPGRSALKGLDQIRFDFLELFIKQIEPQHRDLQAALAQRPADVIVGDPSVGAGFTVSELGGPPNAVYNITCLGIGGREVAPFGLGLLPSGSLAGRARNRLLEFVAPNIVFRTVSKEIARQCRLVGAAPRKFSGVLLSPYLFLQPTAEAFEYRRSDLPPQVHFIGALLPDAPADFTPPAWWGEVVGKQRPVVLVTQGTVATRADELVAPTVRALAGDDVLVIAAGVRDQSQLGLDSVPANARIERFVPFKPLMPMVDLYVTNGGFGGVQYALSNGVPVVAAGTTEDKAEIGNRVAYSGAGINLKTATPTAGQVGDAVRTILAEPTYREKARVIQAELAAKDAPALAASLLERLAETRAPVLRG
jgi:UDP:flavonoid glycosyltransferase YjiC (YdhE family)